MPKRIPVQFIAAPLAVDSHGARLMLGCANKSDVAWRKEWWRLRRAHDLEPIPGSGGLYSVRAIERAVESRSRN